MREHLKIPFTKYTMFWFFVLRRRWVFDAYTDLKWFDIGPLAVWFMHQDEIERLQRSFRESEEELAEVFKDWEKENGSDRHAP